MNGVVQLYIYIVNFSPTGGIDSNYLYIPNYNEKNKMWVIMENGWYIDYEWNQRSRSSEHEEYHIRIRLYRPEK